MVHCDNTNRASHIPTMNHNRNFEATLALCNFIVLRSNGKNNCTVVTEGSLRDFGTISKIRVKKALLKYPNRKRTKFGNVWRVELNPGKTIKKQVRQQNLPQDVPDEKVDWGSVLAGGLFGLGMGLAVKRS